MEQERRSDQTKKGKRNANREGRKGRQKFMNRKKVPDRRKLELSSRRFSLDPPLASWQGGRHLCPRTPGMAWRRPFRQRRRDPPVSHCSHQSRTLVRTGCETNPQLPAPGTALPYFRRVFLLSASPRWRVGPAPTALCLCLCLAGVDGLSRKRAAPFRGKTGVHGCAPHKECPSWPMPLAVAKPDSRRGMLSGFATTGWEGRPRRSRSESTADPLQSH
jgi:hypothetical protein